MIHSTNKYNYILIVLISIFLFNSCTKESSEKRIIADVQFTSASEIITAMTTGFNLGNTFEYNLHSTEPESIFPIIDLYHAAGMKHIRIPVTWMDGFNGDTLSDSNGNIDFSHPRFLQLEVVINYALNKNMFVILNAHHEYWLYDNYDGSATFNDKFSNLWTNIANHFKDYSQQLIFEVLNEPQGVFGDWNNGSNPMSTNALDLTRQINKVGYDAIRSTGGLNLNRVVMISSNAMGNHYQLDDVYPIASSLPGNGSDPFLAVHLHTYDPWEFCGQNGSNDAWPGSEAIVNGLELVVQHANSLQVPVNYGEFGVGRSENASERNSEVVRLYYRAMRLKCLSENMAPTVWDDRGWFGLVNQSGTEFIYNIVPSMMLP